MNLKLNFVKVSPSLVFIFSFFLVSTLVAAPYRNLEIQNENKGPKNSIEAKNFKQRILQKTKKLKKKINKKKTIIQSKKGKKIFITILLGILAIFLILILIFLIGGGPSISSSGSGPLGSLGG